ncbi:MAG TPA: hypothetical protein VFJ16_28940 [Longimicrobium sp.]|nr:hypothetical protein [Longimicrobium sp.]
MLAFAAAVALVAGACGRDLIFLPPEDPAAPLFEVEYQSTAWSTRWNGFYVDGAGRVYEWDHGETRNTALEGDVLTPEQLSAKYSPGHRLVKTLPAGEALQRYERVSEAASASLADMKGVCADAGIARISAWVWNAGDQRFHRILLHQRGDEGTTRRGDAARALWKWIDSVTLQGAPDTMCDPYPD